MPTRAKEKSSPRHKTNYLAAEEVHPWHSARGSARCSRLLGALLGLLLAHTCRCYSARLSFSFSLTLLSWFWPWIISSYYYCSSTPFLILTLNYLIFFLFLLLLLPSHPPSPYPYYSPPPFPPPPFLPLRIGCQVHGSWSIAMVIFKSGSCYPRAQCRCLKLPATRASSHLC